MTEQYPVSAEYSGNGEWESPGVAFEDYGRMHTERHVGRWAGWTPEFATNTEQLRTVLMLRAWRYAHGPVRFPDNANWEELNGAATEKALAGHDIRPGASRKQFEMRDSHIAAVKRAGGYLQLQGAIAYRAWRLNQDSVTVAESLGITPVNVRANLERMRDIALRLGFPIGRVHHTRGTKRVWRNPRPLREQSRNSYQSYVDFCRSVKVPPMMEQLWDAIVGPMIVPWVAGCHGAADRAAMSVAMGEAWCAARS